jgi:CRP-like cAMP-binding protein
VTNNHLSGPARVCGHLLRIEPSTLGHTPYSLRATAVGHVELVFVSQLKLEELVRQDTMVSTALLRVVGEELVDLRRKLSLLNLQVRSRQDGGRTDGAHVR